MTVLMREELNDADLAWAAGDPSVARVVAQLLSARCALAADRPMAEAAPRDGHIVEPALLRARGAL